MDKANRNHMSLIKNVLMGVLVSPIRLVNTISNKVVYIGYYNILKVLHLAVVMNVVLLVLSVKDILKFRVAFYIYGSVPVVAKLISLFLLVVLTYVHSTKGVFIKKDYLDKELNPDLTRPTEFIESDGEDELPNQNTSDKESSSVFEDDIDVDELFDKFNSATDDESGQGLNWFEDDVYGYEAMGEVANSDDGLVLDLGDTGEDEDIDTGFGEDTDDEEPISLGNTGDNKTSNKNLLEDLLKASAKPSITTSKKPSSIFDDDEFLF